LGRFDFSWDGKNPPKLLEYNADTPSLLLESAKLQKDWFNSVHRNGGKTQSNYLEPALIYALKEIVTFCKGYGSSLSIGLLVVDDDDESLAQMLYIKKLLGYATGNNVIENIKEMWVTYSTRVALQNTGCLPVWRLFDKEVRCLINQYPKEWLINEIESDELLKYDFQQLLSIEPWWKIILGNKLYFPCYGLCIQDIQTFCQHTLTIPHLSIQREQWMATNGSVSHFMEERASVFFIARTTPVSKDSHKLSIRILDWVLIKSHWANQFSSSIINFPRSRAVSFSSALGS